MKPRAEHSCVKCFISSPGFLERSSAIGALEVHGLTGCHTVDRIFIARSGATLGGARLAGANT